MNNEEKGKKQFPKEFYQHVVPKGVSGNPDGKPKGTKNARTIVREFMDNKIETLKGTRISRFQYMLWSMYEINFRLMKQLELSKERLIQSQKYIETAEKLFSKGEVSPSELKLAEAAERSRSREYENLLFKVQESQGKLSEFFLKASGQYLEKKEIEERTKQPLLVTADKESLKEAIEEIHNEL